MANYKITGYPMMEIAAFMRRACESKEPVYLFTDNEAIADAVCENFARMGLAEHEKIDWRNFELITGAHVEIAVDDGTPRDYVDLSGPAEVLGKKVDEYGQQ